MNWKEIFRYPRTRSLALFCVATLCMILFFMPTFYQQVLTPKKGVLLNDFVLSFFQPIDFSFPVFIILYLSVIQTLIMYWRQPAIILTGVSTYCAVNILRMVTMYTVTLEPPPTMILLVDPISSIAYPDSGFTKDLFFSGHVSTMMVLVLIERNKWLKIIKAVGTLAMGIFLAWQHVHYTVDLVVAPVITYLVFARFESVMRFSGLREAAVGKK